MGQVAPMRQVKAHDGIARFQSSQKYGSIGLSSTMWLHIGIFGIEQFLNPVDGQLLRLVNNLTTSIIPSARITFCILVGHAASHGFQHLVTNEIFGGNQLYTIELALSFLFN